MYHSKKVEYYSLQHFSLHIITVMIRLSPYGLTGLPSFVGRGPPKVSLASALPSFLPVSWRHSKNTTHFGGKKEAFFLQEPPTLARSFARSLVCFSSFRFREECSGTRPVSSPRPRTMLGLISQDQEESGDPTLYYCSLGIFASSGDSCRRFVLPTCSYLGHFSLKRRKVWSIAQSTAF